MNSTASYKITWMTFICNVIILFHHANLKTYFSNKYTLSSAIVMDFFSALSVIAMTWFFFITGYLFYRNLEYDKIPLKWKSRVKSLVIPYIIWNTISVILELLKGSNIFHGGLLNFIRYNYIYFNQTGSANGPLWYVFRIIEFTAIAFLFLLVIKKKYAFFVVEILIVGYNIIGKVDYFDFSYFLPIYLMGGYLAHFHSDFFESKLAQENSKYKNRVVPIILIAVIISVLTKALGDYDLEKMAVLILSLRYIVLLPILFSLFYLTDIKAPSKFIKSGGMLLYCAHDILYRIGRNILKLFDLGMIASWSLLIIFAFIVCYFAWYIMRNYMPNMLKLLVGGRA